MAMSQWLLLQKDLGRDRIHPIPWPVNTAFLPAVAGDFKGCSIWGSELARPFLRGEFGPLFPAQCLGFHLEEQQHLPMPGWGSGLVVPAQLPEGFAGLPSRPQLQT